MNPSGGRHSKHMFQETKAGDKVTVTRIFRMGNSAEPGTVKKVTKTTIVVTSESGEETKWDREGNAIPRTATRILTIPTE